MLVRPTIVVLSVAILSLVGFVFPCSLVLCVMFCRSLFVLLSFFCHYVVCPSSIYGFWLPLWYLRFTDSDYPFGIFKLSLSFWDHWQLFLSGKSNVPWIPMIYYSGYRNDFRFMLLWSNLTKMLSWHYQSSLLRVNIIYILSSGKNKQHNLIDYPLSNNSNVWIW